MTDLVPERLVAAAQLLRPDLLHSGTSLSLTVGTDCSGIESPIIALYLLSVALLRYGLVLSWRHRFSCDKQKDCIRFIAGHMRPDHVFSDIFDRQLRDQHYMSKDVLQNNRYVPVPVGLDVYVAGFQCTPWSRRHVKSRKFQEADAAVFYAVKRYIEYGRPRLVVLENVEGLNRLDESSIYGGSCLDRIIDELQGIGGYSVVHKLLCPSELGFPILRRRYWFIMHRLDVARTNAGGVFVERLQKLRVPLSTTFLEFFDSMPVLSCPV